jgi:hypothetical protein
MPITDETLQFNAPRGRSREGLASRLAAIRAEIRALLSAPYSYGTSGPHRRRRDEFILQAIAAAAYARWIESVS